MLVDGSISIDSLAQMSDEDLCRLSQQQNEQAEEILVSRFQKLVRSCSRPLYLAGGDFEDLLQEGMFGLIRAMREYDPTRESSFSTFAETCIRNCLYSALRAASSNKHSVLNQSIPLDPELFEANTATVSTDPEMLLIDKEQAMERLQDARRLLSDFETKILGYYLEGLTCREIATVVGKTTKSVDNAVQRIRRKVAQ